MISDVEDFHVNSIVWTDSVCAGLQGCVRKSVGRRGAGSAVRGGSHGEHRSAMAAAVSDRALPSSWTHGLQVRKDKPTAH